VSSFFNLNKASSHEQKKNEDCANTKAQSGIEESFGLHLFTLRERLGITQRAAALKCEVSRGYYSELENSKRPPPPKRRVMQLGAALGASPNELAFLCSVAQSERLAHRALPTDRPDLQVLVRHLLLRGLSLHPSQVVDLLHRARADDPHCGRAIKHSETCAFTASGACATASPGVVQPPPKSTPHQGPRRP